MIHGWIASKELLLFHAIPSALSTDTACGLPIYEVGELAPLGPETVTKLSLARGDDACSVCEGELRDERARDVPSGHVLGRHAWRPSDGG